MRRKESGQQYVVPIDHRRKTLPDEKSSASIVESRPPVISSQGLCRRKLTQLAMLLCALFIDLTRVPAAMSMTAILPESSADASRVPFAFTATQFTSSLLYVNFAKGAQAPVAASASCIGKLLLLNKMKGTAITGARSQPISGSEKGAVSSGKASAYQMFCSLFFSSDLSLCHSWRVVHTVLKHI